MRVSLLRSMVLVALTGAGLAGPTTAADWTWAHPRPAGVDVREIVRVGDRLLAFGPDEVLTSPDGATWNRLGTASDPSMLEAVVFAGRVFAVDTRSVQSSLDGLEWDFRLDLVGEYPYTALADLAASETTLVAVGFDSWEPHGSVGWPLLWYSADGLDWSRAALPPMDPRPDVEELLAVTWDGRQFVAVGGGGAGPVVYTSADGREWTRSVGVGGPTVAAGGGRVVVATVGQAWWSTDGQTWTPVTLPAGVGMAEIEWAIDRFVAATGSGVLTSADGETWTYHGFQVADQLGEVASIGNRIVVGGRDFLSSDDGVDWQRWQTQRLTTAALKAVATSAQEVVAIGESGTILRSTDGSAWELTAAGGPLLTGVVNGGGRWVVISASGEVLWSDDGLAWEAAATGVGPGGATVAWGDGLFLATGWSGRVLTSRDGTVWEAEADLEGSWATGPTWASGEFIAVFNPSIGDSVLAHSVDGRSWQFTPAPDGCHPASLAAVGRNLVLCCRWRLWSSSDGVVWTPTAQDRWAEGLWSAAGWFLASVGEGELLASRDGLAWESRGSLPSSVLAVTGCGHRAIAVGSYGSILLSDDVLASGVRRRLSRGLP